MQTKSGALMKNQLKIRTIAFVALSIMVSNSVAAPANSEETLRFNAPNTPSGRSELNRRSEPDEINGPTVPSQTKETHETRGIYDTDGSHETLATPETHGIHQPFGTHGTHRANASQGTTGSSQAPRISHDKMILAKATAGNKDGKPKVINLNLSKLRDTGLAIRQIRQQALNIYLEATRKEIRPTDRCAIADPVPEDVDLTKEACGAYLPPRKEWLVVYLTAIEPVSQLLRKWQGNLSAGTVVRTVPKGTAAKFRPVNKQFFEEALKIEKELDALHDIFESEQSDNVKLANVSKGLLNSARNLEKLREQEFAILKEAALKGVKETEVL